MTTRKPFLFAQSIATLDKPGTNGRRRFSGVAYSGDRVGNGYGGDVVIDISTSKIEGESLGILYQHDPSKIVGSGRLKFGTQMTIDGELSAVTEDAKRIGALADEGFPWQMSVHIEPGEIDEVRSGATVAVNGRKFTGPITVFRSSLVREVSFTPVGRDAQTSAEVFSRHGASLTDLAAANARADAAEAEVRGTRLHQLQALATWRGQAITEQDTKAFLTMTSVQFAAYLKLVGYTDAHRGSSVELTPGQRLLMLAAGGNEHQLALARNPGSSLVRKAVVFAQKEEQKKRERSI